MDSEGSSYSTHSKSSIAHLLDDSCEQSTGDIKRELKLDNFLHHSASLPPPSAQTQVQNQENGSNGISSTIQLAEFSANPVFLRQALTDLPSSDSVPTSFPETESKSASTSVESSLLSELHASENGSSRSNSLDGKKRRGRPRLHPEVLKVKKSARGRPRSETSKRAMKEAAKVAINTGNTENEQDQSSVSDSNISGINVQASEDLNMRTASIDPVLEAGTAKSIEDSGFHILNTSPAHEFNENGNSTPTSKRKASLSSGSTPSDPKPKSKKIKKEKSNDNKKQTCNASTSSPSVLIDSSVHASEAELDAYIAPSSKKKKAADSSKKSKKASNGTNDSSQHIQDLNDDDNNSSCICRKGDTGKWMIACDNCDEWLHGSCVNLTESKAQLLIKYICPRCAESTQLTSVFKRKCRLPDCDLPIQYEEHAKGDTNPKPISKYCSPDHGVQFFRSLVNKGSTQKAFDLNVLTPAQLAAFVNSCKSVKQFHKLGARFPAAKLLPSEKDIEAAFSETDKQLVNQLQQKIDGIQEKLKYNELKMQFISQCKERAKLISEELIKQGLLNGEIDEEPKRSKKKKKQPKSKRDICGYNSQLTLGDEEWIEFIDSELGQTMLTQDLRQLEEQDSTFTCLNDKRKCSRHSGWQSLSSQFCANLERFYTIEQEKIKLQMSELYYKQQVQLMTRSGNNVNYNSGNNNQTIIC
jgi:COMPASS component SPP1